LSIYLHTLVAGTCITYHHGNFALRSTSLGLDLFLGKRCRICSNLATLFGLPPLRSMLLVVSSASIWIVSTLFS
jgi:hypothetical protein